MNNQEIQELIDRAGDEKDKAINDLIDENADLRGKIDRMKKEIQKLKDRKQRYGDISRHQSLGEL